MTPYYKIQSTLIAAVRALLPALPISNPDQELPPSQQADGGWLAIHNLRGQSLPVTLGDRGEDNHPGVLQVDVNVAAGKGAGVALEYCDALASGFPAGTRLAYNGGEVVVSSVSVGSGVSEGGFYRIPVSVTYFARSVRRA